LWGRALRDAGGDEGAAIARLDRVEEARLARDRSVAQLPLRQGQNA